MANETGDEYIVDGGRSNLFRNVVTVIAIVYVVVSLYLLIESRSRINSLEKAQQATNGDIKTIATRMGVAEKNLKNSTEELGARLGMTQQDLQKRMAERAAQLERQQQRISEEQRQQFGQVSGEVAGVRTDLGSTKTELAATKTDLETTKQKLERAMGDLGVQSGLIARTRDDLEYLKHRGDRNYYEFTLNKGQTVPVSTVSLQLKKVDPKKGKFNLNVIADDRSIEKKDRTMMEPLQFYTGRDRMLYEVVIMTVAKNRVTGYLSTPKNAPEPISK